MMLDAAITVLLERLFAFFANKVLEQTNQPKSTLSLSNEGSHMTIESAMSETLERLLTEKLETRLEAIITRAVAGSQPSEHGSDRLSLHEAAKRLGLSYRTVKARVDAGELRGFADGRYWFVLLRDVWEYNEHLASEIDDNERDLLRRSLEGGI